MDVALRQCHRSDASIWSLGQTAATYVCVEERTVGWEKRRNGQEVVGKFKVSEGKIIIKWNPEKIWSGLNDLLDVPYISVAEQGRNYTYKSGTCDSNYRDNSFERKVADANCQKRLTDDLTRDDDVYGDGTIHYVFRQSLRYRPPSTQYVEVVIGTTGAYLTQGTCAIID